jgi:hypothetical protein
MVLRRDVRLHIVNKPPVNSETMTGLTLLDAMELNLNNEQS